MGRRRERGGWPYASRFGRGRDTYEMTERKLGQAFLKMGYRPIPAESFLGRVRGSISGKKRWKIP